VKIYQGFLPILMHKFVAMERFLGDFDQAILSLVLSTFTLGKGYVQGGAKVP